MIQSLAPQRPGGRPNSRPSSRSDGNPSSRPNSRPSSKIAAKAVIDGNTSSRPSSSKVAAVPTKAPGDKSHSRDVDSFISSKDVGSTGSSKGAPSSKHLSQGLNRHAAFGSSVGQTVKGCSTAAVARAGKQPAAGLHSSTADSAGSAAVSADLGSALTMSNSAYPSSASVVTRSSAGSVTTSSSSHTAAKSGKAAAATNSNKAGSAGKISHKLSAQKTFRFEDLQKEDEELKATVQPELPVLSEASLTHRIVQQLDFTGSHHDDHHLFLEVCSIGQFGM